MVISNRFVIFDRAYLVVTLLEVNPCDIQLESDANVLSGGMGCRGY